MHESGSSITVGAAVGGFHGKDPGPGRKEQPADRLVHLFLILLVAAVWMVGVRPGPAMAATPTPVLGTVYVFRPIGGKYATPEMDNIAAKIRARGLAAEVFNYVDWLRPANAAIARYKSEAWKSAIMVVGHSAGGDSAIRFALWLKRAGVPVNLIVTLDPTRIASQVPGNVQRFINVYASLNTLGGGDPKPAPDFHGHFASVDLKNFHEWHLELPKIAGLQDAVIDKMMAVAEDTAAPGTSGVRIEYAIPRGQPIVLWDSGVTVEAKDGETVADVAAQYGVPVWAVAEINHVDPGSHLSARRLVVPRMFEAAPAQDPK